MPLFIPGLPLMLDKSPLRKRLRSERAALSTRERAAASRAATAHLLRTPSFLRARRIAVYHASGNELDPTPVVTAARSLGKHCYLPVLHPFLHGKLVFAPWRADTAMQPNRFGIPEPAGRERRLPTRRLDLVIVPLLGFDRRGVRLGMGGGYYDRTFAFRQRFAGWRKPLLVGFAYAFQRVERLPNKPWDVRLDAVVTEDGVMDCSR